MGTMKSTMAKIPFALTAQFKCSFPLQLCLARPRLCCLTISLFGQTGCVTRLVRIRRKRGNLLGRKAVDPAIMQRLQRTASHQSDEHHQRCMPFYCTHCVGFAPSLLTCTRTAASLPPSPGRAATKIVSPGLMSARLPGTDCDIGVPGGTSTFTVPLL